jgi:hypothetical protein
VRPEDFFTYEEDDFLGFSVSRPQFDRALVAEIRRGPLEDRGDAEVAVALARLIHDELEVYGTSGDQALKDPEMREALVALNSITRREDAPVSVEFR